METPLERIVIRGLETTLGSAVAMSFLQMMNGGTYRSAMEDPKTWYLSAATGLGVAISQLITEYKRAKERNLDR